MILNPAVERATKVSRRFVDIPLSWHDSGLALSRPTQALIAFRVGRASQSDLTLHGLYTLSLAAADQCVCHIMD